MPEDMDTAEKRKPFAMPAIELRFLGSPARTFIAVPTQLIPEFALSLSGTVILMHLHVRPKQRQVGCRDEKNFQGKKLAGIGISQIP